MRDEERDRLRWQSQSVLISGLGRVLHSPGRRRHVLRSQAVSRFIGHSVAGLDRNRDSVTACDGVTYLPTWRRANFGKM